MNELAPKCGVDMIISGQMTEMQPTNYAKRLMTFDMLNRGVGFFIASEALNDPIQGFVKSHLLCQSVECFLKGLFLLTNYDEFQPKLRDCGHNLLKLVEITENVYRHDIPKTHKAEIILLNQFYKTHASLRWTSQHLQSFLGTSSH